jgi:hypothetical protein
MNSSAISTSISIFTGKGAPAIADRISTGTSPEQNDAITKLLCFNNKNLMEQLHSHMLHYDRSWHQKSEPI